MPKKKRPRKGKGPTPAHHALQFTEAALLACLATDPDPNHATDPDTDPTAAAPYEAPRRLRDLHGGMIFSLGGFLSEAECARVVALGQAAGFPRSYQREGRGYAHRDNGRLQVDSQAVADQIHQRLAPFLPRACDGLGVGPGRVPAGCYSNMRLYEYRKGQRFGQHVDESSPVPALGRGAATEFTLLVYLSACEGGHTVFYGDDGRPVLSVEPTPGMLLLHGHGERCLLHEGQEVTGGTKYLLRTDVVFRDAGGD